MSAHDAMPLASDWSAALPGREEVEGLRLTSANIARFPFEMGAPNGRCRVHRGGVCENGPVLLAVTDNVISKWPPAALYGAGAGVLLVGLLVGVLINRFRGHRAIAQRVTALATRLGVAPNDD